MHALYESSKSFPSNKDVSSAILFTGGKDSNIAYYVARYYYNHTVNLAVTIGPANPQFKAHNLDLIKHQCTALGLNFLYCPLLAKDENWELAYEELLSDKIFKEYGIECIITGDIDFVGSMTSNFVYDRCKNIGMECILPIWNSDRLSLLRLLIDKGFYVYFTLVKAPWFTESWIGRRLDEETIIEMEAIEGLDLCGENGEYHTMVLDGPDYIHALRVEGTIDAVSGNNDWWYLNIRSVNPCEKGDSSVVNHYTGSVITSKGREQILCF